MKSVHGKLGNMRKAVSGTVYPNSYNESKSETAGARTIFIQSDKRACAINVETGKGMLSNGRGHPGFHSTMPALGAKEVDVPREFIDECLKAQPKSGDTIGRAGTAVVRIA